MRPENHVFREWWFLYCQIVYNAIDTLKGIEQIHLKGQVRGGANAAYQWQYSSNGGETWTGSSATGAKTASISVGAMAYRNGQMYRCIVTNEIGSVISDPATLTVQ